jgi:iron(III) transport system substrate-binding protein
MTKRRWFFALLALLLLLAGCGAQSDDLRAYAPAPAERLTVCTSHKEAVYGPIIAEFQERTGIWVEVVTGGTEELLERISGQRDTPLYDVMFGGGVESLRSYADCFEPWAGPDAAMLRPGMRQADDLCTPFSALPIVLIYNTRLVQPGELIGWADLLNERWKGNIAFADPAVSGSSYTAIITMLTALGGDENEIMQRFYANLDGKVLPDSGAVPEEVAAGTLAVGVTLEETAVKRIAQGDSIGIVYPAEGTSILPDGTALIAGAPHRDNAVAFLEFVQSADVQALVVSDFSRRSVRTDVADRTELLPAETLAVVDYDVDTASARKADFLRRWAALREGA